MAEARGMAGGWRHVAPADLGRLTERLTATPLIPVGVAVGLGLLRAGEKSIWLDEGLAVAVARLPTLEMLSYLWRVEFHAAAYYLALHPWLALGDSEAVIRALSLVFGVVAVLATWAIGRRFGVGFSAALILAVSPAFVQYAQEARTFALLIAASSVSTLLLLRLLESPGRLRGGLYAAAAIFAIYAHPLGALVVVGHAVAVAFFAPPRWRLRMLALYAPIVLGWLPMIRFALSHRDRMAEIEPLTAEVAARELTLLGGGTVVTLALLALLLLGLRRDVIAAWLLVPLAGIFVVSLVIQPSLLARYLVSVLPAAAVIAARNGPLLVALLVAVSLAGTWNFYERGGEERYREAAAWVAAAAQPTDGVVFAPAYLRPAFGYYARVGIPLHPPVDWSQSDLIRGEPDLDAVRAIPRVWLVEAHSRELPAELSAILATFEQAEQREYDGLKDVRVTLLVNRTAAAP